MINREGETKFSSTLVLADMACSAGTAEVSNFIIITSGKHTAPVLNYRHYSTLSFLFHLTSYRIDNAPLAINIFSNPFCFWFLVLKVSFGLGA